MDGMDDLLDEFATDTREALEEADLKLVELEHESEPSATLNQLFRLMHTIKGTCGFLGLTRMAGIAHSAETLMDLQRNGAPVTSPGVEAVLQVVDRLRTLLDELEANNGQEPEGDDSSILEALSVAIAVAKGEAPEAAEPSADHPPAAESAVEAVPAAPPAAPAGPPAAKPAAAPPAAKPKAPVAADKADKPEASDSGADRSIRVSVETLEHLMTVVSELVLTRNELVEVMRNHDNNDHKLALQRLSTVTGELQTAVMSTRMQPIGNAWRKLPRIVRDVAANLKKSIELEMTGANTELDRQVLELIKDPLMHMVRNAADHGLEMPYERDAAGKPPTGTIKLNAYHEGGQILVEIADDGKGLDVERIRAKVIERGVATADEAARMSDEQIFSFIFDAGFSTAKEVTAVSGRGVGMDVVQSNVEKIGGHIDVRSTPGVGSVFTLKIPLTLAILRALVIGVGDQEFAVPQTAVDELVKVEPGGQHAIKMIKDAPVVRSRDRLLPVVDLRERLNVATGVGEEFEPASENTRGFVMVIRARGMQFGILVDRVLRTEEIVVKPMPATLRGIVEFSGATILGDGRVIMIVDPNGLRAAVSASAEAAAAKKASREEESEEPENDRQLLLLFKAQTQNRKVLPISLITRLEDVDLTKASESNGQWHIQYHDELIPLVWFGDAPTGEQEHAPLLVMSDAGRSMGLIADQIIDIVEDTVSVQIPSEHDGILGSAIIKGEPAEVIDVAYFLGRASAHWFEPKTNKFANDMDQILLVDDSAFFRNLVAPVVRSAGFDPVVFGSGAEALAKLRDGLRPRIIVTDVDMPEMDGFEFAEAAFKIDGVADIPFIALSGLVNEDAIERARVAGFTDYVSKLDRNGLILTLREFSRPSLAKEAA